MATILKNGEIFVHVPKAGGSFIRKVFEELGIVKRHLNFGSSHCTTRVIKSQLDWQDNWPFIFCFVRHPISWYESYYKFMTTKRLRGHPYKQKNYPLLPLEHMLRYLKEDGALTFNNFLKEVLAYRPGFVTELYSCYDTFECAYVGKQETLKQDLYYILSDLMYDITWSTINNIGTINKSPSIDIKWDPGLKREILETEAICLRRYDYDDIP